MAGVLLLVSCRNEKEKLEGLRTYQYTGGTVRSGSLSYDQTPPAGGSYNAFWQTCAEYAAPIYAEYAVHSLARGALWLTYRPDVSPAELSALKLSLAEPIELKNNGEVSIIKPMLLVSPVPEQDSPLMLTAWNAQVSAESATDKNLLRFKRQFARHEQAPEWGKGCENGFTGTRLPVDGSDKGSDK